jgi:hypothetical protein
MKRLIATGAMCSMLAMGFATGCGSSDKRPVSTPPPSTTPPPPRAETLEKPTMNQFTAALQTAQGDIDRTLASLAALTDPAQTNLQGAYDKYCDSVARMEETARSMKTQADAMRASRDTYFASWEEKTSEIDNPTIRASAEARRKRLRDAHEQIVTASGEAKDAYVPFIKDLNDIKKYLSTDLSKQSVADLVDANKKVQVSGGVVKQKLANISNTMAQVQGGPATAPAAP